ncbi:MAG: BamA/TamA family outer membrane protein [Microscillaceae bacterium]|nr:BamA/TamA family outer membrane protein [Microscillaceae bacterium]MDW8459605.1 BamA/TamA family outer membrane protein [Cytophagales bacterium]
MSAFIWIRIAKKFVFLHIFSISKIKKIERLIYFFVFLALIHQLSWGICFGQDLIKNQRKIVKLTILSEISAKELKKMGLKSYYVIKDSLQILLLSQHLIQKIQNAGYLETQLHSLHHTGDTILLQLQTNSMYRWKKLGKGNLPNDVFSNFFSKKNDLAGKPFSWNEVQVLQNQILNYAENIGYPFATIQLDSIQFDNYQISASWHWQAGKLFFFDTLQIKGNAKVKTNFLKKYLRLYPDQVYNQKKIEKAQKIIYQIPFVQVEKPLSIRFEQNVAKPLLTLNHRKINQFDGILGLLPNEERQNSLLLTGELNLKLHNLFGQGILLKAEWQRLQTNAQNLNLQYEHPVILGSVIDLQAQLQLLQQDSSFLNVERKASILYRFLSNDRLSLDISLRTSRLGTTLQNRNENAIFLSNTDFLSTGLGYQWNGVDNIFYPKQGSKGSLQVQIGNKTLTQTTAVPDSIFRLFRSPTVQVLAKADIEKYMPIRKKNILLLRLQVGIIANENLFLNDLFRVGGLNSLRGHNQNFFFASQYGIFTCEYRMFSAENSYFFVFYDQAYLQRHIQNFTQTDYPLGIGLGASFAVKAGIFNIAYALGQAQEQPLAFNRAKIHFGLISRF